MPMASNYSLSALPLAFLSPTRTGSRFDPLTATPTPQDEKKLSGVDVAASAALPLVRLGHFAEDLSGVFYTDFYTGEGF